MPHPDHGGEGNFASVELRQRLSMKLGFVPGQTRPVENREVEIAGPRRHDHHATERRKSLTGTENAVNHQGPSSRTSWAQMLRRYDTIGVRIVPGCGVDLRMPAAIKRPAFV